MMLKIRLIVCSFMVLFCLSSTKDSLAKGGEFFQAQAEKLSHKILAALVHSKATKEGDVHLVVHPVYEDQKELQGKLRLFFEGQSEKVIDLNKLKFDVPHKLENVSFTDEKVNFIYAESEDIRKSHSDSCQVLNLKRTSGESTSYEHDSDKDLTLGLAKRAAHKVKKKVTGHQRDRYRVGSILTIFLGKKASYCAFTKVTLPKKTSHR